MNHCLLVSSLEWVWGNDSLNLLRQSEGHEFGHSQLHPTAEGDTEVNAKDLTICRVDQEILQMSVAHTYKV